MSKLINLMESPNPSGNPPEFRAEIAANFLGKSQPQMIIAQQVNDPDIMGQIAHHWKHFVSTGQIWALLIGLVIGFAFRGIIGR